MKKCEMCEGKGYEQLQSCYDEIHSRIDCIYCMGDGRKKRKRGINA